MLLLDIVVHKAAPEVGDMAEGGPDEEQVGIRQKAARKDEGAKLGR